MAIPVQAAGRTTGDAEHNVACIGLSDCGNGMLTMHPTADFFFRAALESLGL
jgi:hypothetical protein